MRNPFLATILFLILAAALPGLSTVAAETLTFGLHAYHPDGLLPSHVQLAHASGANAITVHFAWEEVEPEPGRFVWSEQEAVVAAAREHGMGVVGVLSYPPELPLAVERTARTDWPSGHVDDWIYFVASVVKRFDREVDGWVIDGGAARGGHDLFTAAEAETHAEFVRVTAEAARKGAPGARVFVVAPAADLGWLGLFAYYEGLVVVDGLALDLHRWPSPPTGLTVVVNDVRTLVQQYDEVPLLWAWQFGYPTHQGISLSEPRWRGVTQEEQAARLVQSHVLLASVGVSTVFYDELFDRGSNVAKAGENFGLYTRTTEPKVGATSYAVMTKMLSGLHYARPGDVIERPVAPDEVEPGAEPAVQFGPDAGGQEIAKPYHFVFNYEQFAAQSVPSGQAVTAHVFTGEPGTVIAVWTEPAAADGGCQHGCGHADILRWLDGVPVRVFNMLGEPVPEQSELRAGSAPLYIQLPMELVP